MCVEWCVDGSGDSLVSILPGSRAVSGHPVKSSALETTAHLARLSRSVRPTNNCRQRSLAQVAQKCPARHDDRKERELNWLFRKHSLYGVVGGCLLQKRGFYPCARAHPPNCFLKLDRYPYTVSSPDYRDIPTCPVHHTMGSHGPLLGEGNGASARPGGPDPSSWHRAALHHY